MGRRQRKADQNEPGVGEEGARDKAVPRVRAADREELELLARLNRELVEAEGARNELDLSGLRTRMRQFLDAGMRALIIELGSEPVGYLLFRYEADAVFVRHLLVREQYRGRGIGSRVFRDLLNGSWSGAPFVRLDVLADNATAVEFWRSQGFRPYSLRMELDRRCYAVGYRSCGVVVARKRRGRPAYLLVRQRSDDNWGFPKGHMDAGEREEETALRELREEAGITATLVPGFEQRISYELPSGRRKFAVYFLGEYVSGEPKAQAGEIKSVRWVGYGRARRMLPFKNARRVLDAAHRAVKQWPD